MRALALRHNRTDKNDISMTSSFIDTNKRQANLDFGFDILQVRWHSS